MGALVYAPEQLGEAPTVVKLPALAREVAQVLDDRDGPDLERLFTIGG